MIISHTLFLYPYFYVTSSKQCRELTWIPNLWERKKIEKTHINENNHTHKTIFTWFGNLPTSMELQGFNYYQGKKYKVWLRCFFSLKKHDNQTLISKLQFFTSCAQDSQWTTKRTKKFFMGALPLDPQKACP